MLRSQTQVDELDDLVTHMSGFTQSYPVTGQTYSRKVDLNIVNAIAGLGASAHKVTRALGSTHSLPLPPSLPPSLSLSLSLCYLSSYLWLLVPQACCPLLCLCAIMAMIKTDVHGYSSPCEHEGA